MLVWQIQLISRNFFLKKKEKKIGKLNVSFKILGFYYEIFVNAVFVSNKPLELLGVHQRLVPRVFLEKLPPLLEEDHHL